MPRFSPQGCPDMRKLSAAGGEFVQRADHPAVPGRYLSHRKRTPALFCSGDPGRCSCPRKPCPWSTSCSSPARAPESASTAVHLAARPEPAAVPRRRHEMKEGQRKAPPVVACSPFIVPPQDASTLIRSDGNSRATSGNSSAAAHRECIRDRPASPPAFAELA